MKKKEESALGVLRQAVGRHAGRLVYAASLGAESSVLIDLLCRYGLDVPVVTVDTGRLPAETLEFSDVLQRYYGIRIQRLRPDGEEVAGMIAEHGQEFYRKSVDLRKLCCEVRKVRPLKAFLAGKAWITGRRRAQAATRQALPFVEEAPDVGIAKYNPLADWIWEDVWRYIRAYDVPYHPLYDRGYRSIGCAPCTRAVAAGEDERAGRWWWELDAAPECGLHVNPLTGRFERKKEQAMNSWQGKRVLITGVCGTVGRELLRQVVARGAYEIIGIDNNESELFFLDEEYAAFRNVHLYLGDIRDRDKLMRKMEGVDIVLHAAALKHVILCEKTPRDAVLTNILGTQNVIDAAHVHRVERVIFTSSDKAVNPTNVMGTSKLMGERLMTAANAHRRGEKPIFASTRFGNVLGSRGSVIPLFRKQIAQGGPVTLTDARMTRFIMTIEEAVGLVLDSVFLACGGEVFVTKMPTIRIKDLAEVMIEELAEHPEKVEIKVIGSKPGEKLYEELMNEEETRRTWELERYFVILPAFRSVYEEVEYRYPDVRKKGVEIPYNSATQPPLGKEALRGYLRRCGLLHVARVTA